MEVSLLHQYSELLACISNIQKYTSDTTVGYYSGILQLDTTTVGNYYSGILELDTRVGY